jgi:hypothetical protein
MYSERCINFRKRRQQRVKTIIYERGVPGDVEFDYDLMYVSAMVYDFLFSILSLVGKICIWFIVCTVFFITRDAIVNLGRP